MYEEVPREVIETDYYAVENIKQYYKEIIPEKKIEMVPVESKIKKVQYVPVERYHMAITAGRLCIILRERAGRLSRGRAGSYCSSRVLMFGLMQNIGKLTQNLSTSIQPSTKITQSDMSKMGTKGTFQQLLHTARNSSLTGLTNHT